MLTAKNGREYASLVYNTSRQYQSTLVRPTLSWTGRAIDCPHQWSVNTTCLGPNATAGPAWEMDSGPLNSHDDFGINAPVQDRVALRKLVTCAVLDPKKFIVGPRELPGKFQGTPVNVSYTFLNDDHPFADGNNTHDLPMAEDQLQNLEGFYYTK
jgi:hypothetical protein